MLKYIMLTFSFCSSLHCMEQKIIVREPCEWNPQAYTLGSKLPRKLAQHLLKNFNITVKGSTILDVGCGPGETSRKMAKKAKYVHGIDASKNMVEYAQKKYSSVKNLSFEHCFAEDFTSPNRYKLATSFFCLHWIENKKQVLQHIHNCLAENGEFFATVITQSNPQPLGLTAALELIPHVQQKYPYLREKDLIKGIGASYPTDKKLKKMLHNTGFTLIAYTQISNNLIVKNRKKLETFQRPIFMSRPAVQWIPENLRESIFSQYIDLYLSKLTKNKNGYYTGPTAESTIIHARKVKK